MNYLYLDEIDSTNSYCKKNIDFISDKTVVYTSKQTRGRGRFNRIWVDLGHENIYLSIVLKPSTYLDSVYSNLTQYTALKLAQTFVIYGVNPNIKWPNDILVNDKKISGILAETVFSQNILKGIIIGVGLNLNANKKDFDKIDKKVTSLNLEIGSAVDKNQFLNKFIDNFFADYEKFIKQGFVFIKSDYEKYINFINKEITISNLNEKITGIVQKITNDGAIVINDKKFYTGDIL